jgi:hypothetical protein
VNAKPSTRASRLIAANNSTFDRTTFAPSVITNTSVITLRWGQIKPGRFLRTSQHDG